MSFVRALLIAVLVVVLVVPFISSTAQQATTLHTPSLDVTAMDRSIDPCLDFFAYACGGWIKNNPIPPDQSSWDLYSKMEDENKTKLREILEATSSPDASRTAVNQKIGDYYASCTDEQGIEAKGADPLKPELERIAKISSKSELAVLVDSGLSRCLTGRRECRSGRTRPSRPRLLPQDRPQIRGVAQSLCRARTKDVRVARG